MRPFISMCVMLATLALAPSVVGAQAGAPLRPGGPSIPRALRPDPTLVTIVLVPKLDVPDASAIIMRRAHEQPPNVILVTPRTTPADLAHAVGALATSRRRHGDDVTRDMRAIVSSTSTRGKHYVNERRAADDLRALAAAGQFRINGVGAGRAITVRMGASGKQ